MAALTCCDDSLQSTNHDESQAESPTSPLSSPLPNDNQASALIPAPRPDHRRLPYRELQTGNSGPNAGQEWESGSPWASPPHPQLLPSSLFSSIQRYAEVEPEPQLQSIEHLFDGANCQIGTVDKDGLSSYIDQFSIELLQLLLSRKESTPRLSSKVPKRLVGGLAKCISIPTRLSHHFGISKYSKRTKLYHYVRRRGIEFLAGQFQTLQRCLIEGAESYGVPHERSLARKIAENHPKYGQLAHVVTLMRCMPVDFKQVAIAKDHRELVRGLCMLIQHMACKTLETWSWNLNNSKANQKSPTWKPNTRVRARQDVLSSGLWSPDPGIGLHRL